MIPLYRYPSCHCSCCRRKAATHVSQQPQWLTKQSSQRGAQTPRTSSRASALALWYQGNVACRRPTEWTQSSA
jgi:hypothetical protein